MNLPEIMTRIQNCQRADLLSKIEALCTSGAYIIIDRKVRDLYPDVKALLPIKQTWVLERAESLKNLQEYERCCHFFLENGVQRSSVVIAIGGGATSDFAGFVAATLLRGLLWQVVPTTLLAMIDASIGGKVGLNTALGKNLLGSFHHPEVIYRDRSFLKTLSKDEYHSGLGELTKYLFLDPRCFKIFEEEGLSDALLERAMGYKQEVVARDAKESGERKVLNLGHTLGHAYEYSLSIPHGLAVLRGIESVGRAYFPNLLSERWDKILQKLELVSCYREISSLEIKDKKGFWDLVARDKKMIEHEIDIVLANKEGGYLQKIPLKELQEKVEL